jgi:hypothetical protein
MAEKRPATKYPPKNPRRNTRQETRDKIPAKKNATKYPPKKTRAVLTREPHKKPTSREKTTRPATIHEFNYLHQCDQCGNFITTVVIFRHFWRIVVIGNLW